jgi:hypothetical protein
MPDRRTREQARRSEQHISYLYAAVETVRTLRTSFSRINGSPRHFPVVDLSIFIGGSLLSVCKVRLSALVVIELDAKI